MREFCLLLRSLNVVDEKIKRSLQMYIQAAFLDVLRPFQSSVVEFQQDQILAI